MRLRLASMTFFVAATGLALAQTATKPDPYANIPDAVTADGKHYTVEFENEYVRILRIHYGPHERGNMHNHPHSVTVFLTDGKLRMTTPDGKSFEATVKKGHAVYEEAGPHQPENLADTPFEAVRTELKTPPPSK
jgi:quercetin dioxygenase-like cupin family protein